MDFDTFITFLNLTSIFLLVAVSPESVSLGLFFYYPSQYMLPFAVEYCDACSDLLDIIIAYFLGPAPGSDFYPVTNNSYLYFNNTLNNLEKLKIQLCNNSAELTNYKTSNFLSKNNYNNLIFEHWVFINQLLSPNEYIYFIKNIDSLNKITLPSLEFTNYLFITENLDSTLKKKLLINIKNYFVKGETLEEMGKLKYHEIMTNINYSDNLSSNLLKFYEYQLNLLKIIESIFIKKIINFFLINLLFLLIITFSLAYMCKSTNLIYTLISFLIFAVSMGIFAIVWGAEYIGLCIILIYGAAIPVLALYIIMLVNVDLIQRLFFIESQKSLSIKKQFFYFIFFIFISFFSFSFFLKGTPLSYVNCKDYEFWFHLEMSSFIK